MLKYLDRDKEGTIKFHIKNINELSTCVYSQVVKIGNMPWQLIANTECSTTTGNKKHLSVYSYCSQGVDNSPESDENVGVNEEYLWSCNATTEYRIKNWNSSLNDVAVKTEWVCNFGISDYGVPGFVEWDKLIDEKNGFVKDGGIKIEVLIKVDNIIGVKQREVHDFLQSENLTSDVKLNIEGVIIYVNKDYLSLYSPVFKKMFYSSFVESSMEVITLKDVDIDEFIQFLEVIYPCHNEITDANVKALLKLGDRFDVSYVMKECEKFLTTKSKLHLSLKLYFSDIYRLKYLYDFCMSNITDRTSARSVSCSRLYKYMSESLKIKLFDKIRHFL
uniref:BTB domain-containing protein n=1 Tax=Parastrongyloides trichosuri TaxID=131310 RepID=A0A0N4ZPQ6_PARTI